MHINHFSGFLAQAASSAPAQGGQAQSPLGFFVPIILMIVMFYFLAIRPQQQRSKQQVRMLSTLKSGDKVITGAGIIGTVITVKDKTVTVRSADAKFEVTKASITEIVPDDAGTTTSS